MAQELLDIDEGDHVLAAGAFKRITSKSAIALEAMVDRLGIKGIDPNTPIPDVLNIANFMAKVSSAPEQSKRDLPDGGGENGPRITLIIGGETQSAIGRVLEPDSMPEEGEGEVLDGEWGL